MRLIHILISKNMIYIHVANKHNVIIVRVITSKLTQYSHVKSHTLRLEMFIN